MQNPYIRYKNSEEIIFPPNTKWNPKKPGTLHQDNSLVKLMESKGWEWGGRWTKTDGVIDYMHLQKTATRSKKT